MYVYFPMKKKHSVFSVPIIPSTTPPPLAEFTDLWLVRATEGPLRWSLKNFQMKDHYM